MDVVAAVANGLVLFGGGDGLLDGVSARAGSVLWRAHTGGRIRTAPAVVDKRAYVGSFDGCVDAFDLTTDKQIWRYDTEGAELKSGDYGFDRRNIQSSPSLTAASCTLARATGSLDAIDVIRARFAGAWITTSLGSTLRRRWIRASCSPAAPTRTSCKPSTRRAARSSGKRRRKASSVVAGGRGWIRLLGRRPGPRSRDRPRDRRRGLQLSNRVADLQLAGDRRRPPVRRQR